MARYTNTIATRKSAAELTTSIASYLQSQGYKQVDAEQNIWRKSTLMSNPMFVRFAARPGELELEAWLRFVILPGVHIGEYDLDGMFLVVQKRALKAHVTKIEQLAS